MQPEEWYACVYIMSLGALQFFFSLFFSVTAIVSWVDVYLFLFLFFLDVCSLATMGILVSFSPLIVPENYSPTRGADFICPSYMCEVTRFKASHLV